MALVPSTQDHQPKVGLDKLLSLYAPSHMGPTSTARPIQAAADKRSDTPERNPKAAPEPGPLRTLATCSVMGEEEEEEEEEEGKDGGR